MTSTALYGSTLAAGLVGVVVALWYWQRTERLHLQAALADEDRLHFHQQGVRRRIVEGVLLLIALGICVGSNIPYKLNGRPNRVFVAIWLGVFGLVLPLIALAWVDWLSTRRYARRQRSVILREGIEILRDELKLRTGRTIEEQASGDSKGSDTV